MKEGPPVSSPEHASEAETLRLEIAELKHQLSEKEERLRLLEQHKGAPAQSPGPENLSEREKHQKKIEKIKNEFLESEKDDKVSSFITEASQNEETQRRLEIVFERILLVLEKKEEAVFHRLPTRQESEFDFYDLIIDVSRDLFPLLQESSLKPEDQIYVAKLFARFMNNKLDPIEFTHEATGTKKKIEVQIRVPMIGASITHEMTTDSKSGFPQGFNAVVGSVKEWGLIDNMANTVRKSCVVQAHR